MFARRIALLVAICLTVLAGVGSGPALASATLQVHNIAPTIGNTSVGGLSHTPGGNYVEVSGPFNLGSASAVAKLTGYRPAAAPPTPMRAVIYADNGGNGRVRRAASDAVTIAAGQPAGRSTSRHELARTVAGRQYWPATGRRTRARVGAYTTVANGGRYKAATYSSANPPAANFGAGSSDSISYSLYATLGAAACPSPAPGAVTFESPFRLARSTVSRGGRRPVRTRGVASVAGFATAAAFCFGSRRCGPRTGHQRLVRRPTSRPGRSGGESTGNNHFDASFKLGSTKSTQQPGLFLSVSPDNGSGGRMGYAGVDDQADGIHVIFYDVPSATTPGPCVPAGCAVFGRTTSPPSTARMRLDQVLDGLRAGS